MATLGSVIVDDIVSEKSIDREKTCPLLLRVFCSTGRHNSLHEYSNGVPANELQIYTWLDATLKEISGLVKEVNPDARRSGTILDFSIVYPDTGRSGYMRGAPMPQGQMRAKSIGTTVSGQKTPDDNKNLRNLTFTIGDYLDIAITPPSRVTPGYLPNARRPIPKYH